MDSGNHKRGIGIAVSVPRICQVSTFPKVRLFLRSSFSEGQILERNFAFQNGFGLSIKTTKNTNITALNSSKQLTVTVHGLMFGRANYRKDIICVGNMGAYFREGLFFSFFFRGRGGLIIGILWYCG